uniref:Histone deacetylase domain-containing protein n=1 Tax=Anabas testudineus TaxID=64144 RepID=A0A7N6F5T6_ANATE
NPACKIEVPERLVVSYGALVENGLADRCVSIPVREATDADILLVHSEEYLEAVKKTPYMTLEELKEFTLQYGDVYFHPNIYHCAKLALGATLQLVDNVMTGKVRNGLALVRPPGHHSMRSAASGFCIFNNVAIAAQYVKQKYGVKRVLIVDWDIHHGQGVQYSFEDDPSVLYFSWHRYEHQKFWPNLRESDFDVVGKEKGAGSTINVPWNKVKMQNSDYLSIFFHVLLPVAYEFSPDLVLVCAGFDSAIGDPEGEMCATPDIFAHLTHLLMNLAGGKLCAVLEGGYNLKSLAQSVCQTVHSLLGDPAPRPANLEGPCNSALESLQCVRSAHRKYWSCLKHFYISVLSQGCSDASGFIQAVLGLLLPLGYEYDPSLVLLVQTPGSGICDSVWQQLTGLLQGLAQGHILVAVNPCSFLHSVERTCIDPTCSSLLGDAAPSLGQLHAAPPEDVEAVENLRQRLKADWKLLQTTGEFMKATSLSYTNVTSTEL